MSKKSFWKRANRGFLVSLALIACVLIYVLVTQLMLLSEKSELKGLADSVRDLNQSVHILSDEKLQELQEDTAKMAELDRIKAALEPLFDPDSDYLDAGAEALLANMPLPDGQSERTRTAQESGKPSVEQCSVDGDIATIHVIYTYSVTGEYYNYDNPYADDGELYTPQPVDSASEDFAVRLICKKVDGQWKIFRISSARSYAYDLQFKEAVNG